MLCWTGSEFSQKRKVNFFILYIEWHSSILWLTHTFMKFIFAVEAEKLEDVIQLFLATPIASSNIRFERRSPIAMLNKWKYLKCWANLDYPWGRNRTSLEFWKYQEYCISYQKCNFCSNIWNWLRRKRQDSREVKVIFQAGLKLEETKVFLDEEQNTKKAMTRANTIMFLWQKSNQYVPFWSALRLRVLILLITCTVCKAV